ncbi:MAG: UbiH/UbiF/VisC/COQ6 family ubiquinone biosynthesis hydroxylase [Pseudomonadota bacterium]
MKNKYFPVTIIGGGHAGLTMAILLGQAGIQVTCIDRENPKKFDTAIDQRTTAISYGSAKILEKTGIWKDIQKKACPIEDIQILDGSQSPALLNFISSETDREAFGWIVENHFLRKELINRLKKVKAAKHFSQKTVVDIDTKSEKAVITCEDGLVIETDLVIGADGRNSLTRQKSGIQNREWSYDQKAIVCIVEHENDHQNKAIEHFFAEGPFAVLPMTPHKKGKYRSSIVWTERAKTKKSLLNYDEETFNHALNVRFPKHYGEVRCISERFAYPLNYQHAYSYIGDKVALVADAAHGIHPIAGQGLNLGLRDVECLSRLMIEANQNKEDIGHTALLKQYEQQRRPDVSSMAAATDNLDSLFGNKSRLLKKLRRVGLKATNQIQPAKQFFIKRAMGDTSY